MAGTESYLDVVDVGAGPVDPSEPIAPPPRRGQGRRSRAVVAIVAVGALAIGGWSAVTSHRAPSGGAVVPAVSGVVPVDALPGCPGVVGGVSIAEPTLVRAAIRAHLPHFVVDMTGRTSELGHEMCGAVVRAHRTDGARLVVAVVPTGQPGIRYVVTSVTEAGVATIHLHSVLAPASIEIVLSVPSTGAAAATAGARSLAADLRMSS